MQVDYLFVLSFPSSNSDQETKSGALALCNKPRNREPIAKCQIQFATRLVKIDDFLSGASDVKPEFIVGDQVPDAAKNSDNVGVYLVFHCGSGGDPFLFERAKGMKFTIDPDKAAQGVVKMIGNLGIRKIRKLCLVSCNTANNNDPFLQHICAAINGADFDAKPMVAGWDNYITICDQGSNAGRKMVQDKVTMRDTPVTPDVRKEQKFVYVLSGAAYQHKRFEVSGWSDQVQLPTNTGVSTSSIWNMCNIL